MNPRVIHDSKLLPHQQAVFKSTADDIILFGGRGCGKTFLAARYICRYLANGKNVICAAQTYKTLKKVLFREIIRCLRKWGIAFRVNQSDLTITTEFGSECYCYTYTESAIDNVRGMTGISLVVIDEAALCSKEFYDVCIACCRGLDPWGRPIPGPHSLLISTPKAHSFLNAKIREAAPNEVELIHATSMDNLKYLGQKYIDRLMKDYGNTSFARQEIFGELIDDTAADQLISWIDIEAMLSRVPMRAGDRVLGIDMARYGDDSNTCWYREGSYLERLYKLHKVDTYALFNAIYERYKPCDLDVINIDGTGGFAAGLVDMLRHAGYHNVREVNFSAASPDPKYKNIRAFMYQACALASSSSLVLPRYTDIEQIKEELAAQRIILRETDGKLALLAKDKVREVIKRSPDDSDGIALTFAHVTDLRGNLYKTEYYNAVEADEESEEMIMNIMSASHGW